MKSKIFPRKTIAALSLALLLVAHSLVFAASRSVTINGVRISQEEIVQIDKMKGVPVQNGDYWYDAVSGRWGRITNPVAPKGQTPAKRVVIVNGKRLTPKEILEIETTTGLKVASGKYWLDEATGIWGRVGSPPQGRIGGANSANIQKTPGGGITEFHGDGSWSHRNSNTGTGMIYNPNAGGNWRDKVWVSPR